MNLKEIKEIALANVSDPNTEYFYRYVCRWFSKTFHTPIADVYAMSPDEVFLAYFEEGYEKLSESEDGEETMLNDMMKAVDPDFDEKEEESIQDFIDLIETEEENKRAKKQEAARSKDFAMKDAPTLQKTEDVTQKTSVTTQPVVRNYQDDTPDDDGDL